MGHVRHAVSGLNRSGDTTFSSQLPPGGRSGLRHPQRLAASPPPLRRRPGQFRRVPAALRPAIEKPPGGHVALSREPAVLWPEPNGLCHGPRILASDPEMLCRDPDVLCRDPNALITDPETLWRYPEALIRDPEALWRVPETLIRDVRGQPNLHNELIYNNLRTNPALTPEIQVISQQLAADQAWPWRTPGVATIRKSFLMPVDRPFTVPGKQPNPPPVET